MTNQTILRKIDWFILLYGILLSCGAYFLWGEKSLISVLFGVALAYVNWIFSRVTGSFIVQIGRMEWVIFVLFLKTALILTVVFLILLFTSVEPISFLIGLSTLAISVLTKSFSVSFVEKDTDDGDNE